ATLQLVSTVNENPADQALFDDFLLYMTENEDESIRIATSVIYSLLVAGNSSLEFPPIASFWADLLDPSTTYASARAHGNLPFLTHLAMVLDEVIALDTDEVAIRMFRRGLTVRGESDTPMSILGRIIRQVHRVEPGATVVVRAQDLSNLYGTIASYIRDERRGLERVIHLIQERYGETRRILPVE
ncbi:MAG: hypothetical protein KC561_14540, partial [Myxococcales bacterium]|nr:hypothetical protein [Myxococcales bacterium]